MFEMNEVAIEQLLGSGLVIRDPLNWRQRGVRLRMKVPVDNPLGEQIVIDFHISVKAPWAYSVCLLWAKRPIRRLDVRGSHRDQTGLIDERWERRTHKHTFRDGLALAWVYTPSDIPPTTGSNSHPGEYRKVFEAFCEECGISIESDWSDPPIGSHVPNPLPLSDS